MIDDPDLAPLRLAEYLQRIESLRREAPARGALLDELAQWPDQIGIGDLD